MADKAYKKKSKKRREELLAYCGQLQEDDCVDPREYFKPDPKLAKADKKAKQLCRQVAQTLDLVLGDCDDELMQSLSVGSVQPAPDSSRMLVTVIADVPQGEFDRVQIQLQLKEQTGRLRAEVGRSISRKRVPNLTFSIFLKESLNPPSNPDHDSSHNSQPNGDNHE
ncbi:MAG: ribosome-binding factor A [Mariniblastus sp.]